MEAQRRACEQSDARTGGGAEHASQPALDPVPIAEPAAIRLLPRLIWEGPGRPIEVAAGARRAAMPRVEVAELMCDLALNLRAGAEPIEVVALGEKFLITADYAAQLIIEAATLWRQSRRA